MMMDDDDDKNDDYYYYYGYEDDDDDWNLGKIRFLFMIGEWIGFMGWNSPSSLIS